MHCVILCKFPFQCYLFASIIAFLSMCSGRKPTAAMTAVPCTKIVDSRNVPSLSILFYDAVQNIKLPLLISNILILIIIIIIIWFGDTVTVSHSTKCDTNSKVRDSVVSMLNQLDVFSSALQNYLNQKRKTSNQQAKHSNCWGQPPQKILDPSQSDD